MVRSQGDRPTIRLDRRGEVPLSMMRVGQPGVQRRGIRGPRHGLLEQVDRLGRAAQRLDHIGQAAEGIDMVRLGLQGLSVARGRVLQPPRAVMFAGPLEPFLTALSQSGPPLSPGTAESLSRKGDRIV